MKFCAIQLSNGGLGCVGVGHFDERKAARLTGIPISDDTDSLDSAISGESGLKIVLGCLITEISDKNVGHSMFPLMRKLSLSDSS